MSNQKKNNDVLSEDALEAFLDRAEKAADEDQTVEHPLGGSQHRKLSVVVSADRLEAHLEAVFPDTTYVEVCSFLERERIVRGIQEGVIKAALERADRSGRRQKDVLVATGTPAVYIQRKEVDYPFLKGLSDPETGTPVHIASSVFREIAEVLARDNIDRIRGYAHPVFAVAPGTVLMQVQGEDKIEPGMDIFGKEIRKVADTGPGSLKAGDGIEEQPDGSIVAARFGYVSIVGRFLTVLSPIWVSPDRMEAYFVNPPQLGAWTVPEPIAVVQELKKLGVCLGIEQDVVKQMCRDLAQGGLRESCVRIARGQRPRLLKGQIAFTFEPISSARFEAVQKALQSADLSDATVLETSVHTVRANTVLAEQIEETGEAGPGRDLFGDPVAPSEEAQEKKVFKAGVNVRREAREGRVCYVSEIYGYAGVIDNRITVLSPIWLPPNAMEVYFITLFQMGAKVLPTEEDFGLLLERTQVRHGVDPDAITQLSKDLPESEDPMERAVLIAQGTPPEPGRNGTVELRFKRLPEPGKMLEDGAMDFREREAVPNIEVGHLLAVRSFPTEGKPGTNVRGRLIKPPKTHRELLFTGPGVVSKEENGQQRFYAVKAGFARVIKDTLSVLQRFRHPGDVDYKIGNIRFEGDVEIGGTVKNRFKIEATGDVYIDGAVEHRADIRAGGDIVVRGGIIGGRVKAEGALFAKFIQDAKVEVGEDLVVRHYIQTSEVYVKRKATVQGDQGGRQQLCLLGGMLQAGLGVEAASIGSQYGRQTRVIVGVDPNIETRLVRYQKGLSFCEIRSRQAMRSLLSATGGSMHKHALEKALREAQKGRREFLLGLLKEMQEVSQLQESLAHHVEDLKKAKSEAAAHGRIRVTGTAFPRVTVQIGDTYRLLEEEVEAVVFYLNKEHRIAQDLLSASG